MAVQVRRPPAPDEEGVQRVRCLLPEREHYNGPVTRALVRRTAKAMIGLWTVAALPVILDRSDSLKAAGLGVMIPGGGYLYAGRPGRAALSLGASLLAYGLWFVVGNAALLPTVWLGTAALSARRLRGGR